MNRKTSKDLTYDELLPQWADLWGLEPRGRIGRVMLEASIEFKLWERKTGGLSPDQRRRLAGLVKAYKRDKNTFAEKAVLSPGTRLVRIYNGRKHTVTVVANGFEYDGRIWTSLSPIANQITGSRWNGWVFFGVKQKEIMK